MEHYLDFKKKIMSIEGVWLISIGNKVIYVYGNSKVDKNKIPSKYEDYVFFFRELPEPM